MGLSLINSSPDLLLYVNSDACGGLRLRSIFYPDCIYEKLLMPKVITSSLLASLIRVL